MPATLRLRARRMIVRARRAWAEIDYAQRRMFEIRTGMSSSLTIAQAARSSHIEELEAAFALPARDPDNERRQER